MTRKGHLWSLYLTAFSAYENEHVISGNAGKTIQHMKGIYPEEQPCGIYIAVLCIGCSCVQRKLLQSDNISSGELLCFRIRVIPFMLYLFIINSLSPQQLRDLDNSSELWGMDFHLLKPSSAPGDCFSCWSRGCASFLEPTPCRHLSNSWNAYFKVFGSCCFKIH